MLDEQICTKMTVESPLLSTLQTLMSLGSPDVKQCCLWLLSNMIVNSSKDLDQVCKSGILTNVVLAARLLEHSLLVAYEALWCISSLYS
jgi:hypothetical protein